MGYRKGLPLDLFMQHAAPLFWPGMAVLEVGPGKLRKSLIKQFVDERGCEYWFCDRKNYEEGHAGYVPMLGDYEIGAEAATFDAAVMYEMLHNVDRPWRLLPKVAWVVKPGGFVVVEDVLSYPEFNRHPVDFGRIFPDGMSVLLEDAGLVPEVIAVGNERSLNLPQRGALDTSLYTHIVAVGRRP